VKKRDLTPAAGLTGEELIDIAQDGQSRKLSLGRLLSTGTPAALSSPDRRVTWRGLGGEDEKILEVQIIIGDSKSLGTADERVINNVARYPENAFTLEINDGVGPQGPVLAGHVITGLTPLLECPGPLRPSPIVINPLDGTPIDWGTGFGETPASAQAFSYIEAVEKTTGKRPSVLVAVIGLGGRTYPEMKLGSYHFSRILEVMAAARKYGAALGYTAVRMTGLFVSLGANDVVLDYNRNVTGSLSTEQWAGSILQLKRDLWDQLAIAGEVQFPALYLYQVNRRYPPILLNNRVSPVSSGLRLAARRDPDIVIVNPEYQRQRVDTLHYTAEGNVLNGMENAAAHLAHYAGIGQHQPLDLAFDATGSPRIIWNSPTEFDLGINTNGKRLLVVRETVGRVELLDGGDDYIDQVLAMVGGTGSANALFRAKTCAGRITELVKFHSGAYDDVVEGPCALVPQPTTVTVVAGGSLYLDGARVRVLGGVYAEPLEGFITANADGSVTSFAPMPGSRYSEVPTGDCEIEPIQGGGTGALVRLDNVAGSGATIRPVFFRQFAVADDKPYLLESAGNIISGSGCANGTRLIVQGGVLAPGASAAEVAVVLANLDGKPTYAAITKPGLYEVMPEGPVTATGPNGAIAVFDLPRGGWPLADPGMLGFTLRSNQHPFADPAFSLHPAILSIKVVSLQGGVDNFLRFRLAEPPGPDTLLDHADTNIYGSWARGCIASDPSELVGPGPFEQDVQPWLLAFTIPLVSPFGQAAVNKRPHLINREFTDWPRGYPISFSSAGGYGAAQWRGARNTSTGEMHPIPPQRGEGALCLRRPIGDVSTSSYTLTQVIAGEDLDGLVDRLLNFTFWARALPDWSDPDRMLSFGLYSHTNDTDPMLANGLPAGAVLIRNGNAPLTSELTEFRVSYTVSNRPSVPIGTKAIFLRFLIGATGEAATDQDGVVIEMPDVFAGVEIRPFVPEDRATRLARRRRYHDRLQLAVGATGAPTRYLLRESMRRVPTVTTVGGNAAGFSAAGSTVDSLVVQQTAGATVTLDLSAEL